MATANVYRMRLSKDCRQITRELHAGVTGTAPATTKQSIGLLIDVELQTHENDVITEGRDN